MPQVLAVKERPIIFGAEMVRALLARRKTQTRRIQGLESVNGYSGQLTGEGPMGPLGYRGLLPNDYYLSADAKPAYKHEPGRYHWLVGLRAVPGGRSGENEVNPIPVRCPYGQIGDRLWVREASIIAPKHFATPDDSCIPDADGDLRYVQYLASHPNTEAAQDYKLKKRPALLLPRWASRILLEITSVRVERLHSISARGALSEGIIPLLRPGVEVDIDGDLWPEGERAVKQQFATLWDTLHARDGHNWAVNPWVWVVSVRVLEPQVLAGGKG